MNAVLTPRQQAVLLAIHEGGDEAHPLGGGFWTATKGYRGGACVKLPGPNVTNTIYALEARILLERRDNNRLHSYRAPRYVTGRGLEAVLSLGVQRQPIPFWLSLRALLPSYVTEEDAQYTTPALLRIVADRVEEDHT